MTIMRAPAVSVVLPVCNGAPVIGETIASLRSQTTQDFEIIVIDDGSTDETARILDSIVDDRLVRLRHPTSLGIAAALNAGLDAARAPLVARLDHDDLAHRDRLRRQQLVFAEAPETGIVFTACDVIDEFGTRTGVRTPPNRQAGLMLAMLFGNCATHSTAMYRRDVVTAAGGYRDEWFPAEDYDLWLRLMWGTRIEVLPQPLVAHRVWGRSVSGRLSKRMTAIGRELSDRALVGATGSGADTDVATAFGGGGRMRPSRFRAAFDVLNSAIAAVQVGCRKLGIGDDGLRATGARILRRSGVLGDPRHPAVGNLARLALCDPRLTATIASQSWQSLSTAPVAHA